tara:strand:+ start:206 stop:523 length:318 start_codon:yes stop_codon:yes gene_type:complete
MNNNTQETEQESTTMELCDLLKDSENQDKMFTQAFNIVKEKHNKVNLQNCLCVLLDNETSSEDVLCVGIACLSLLNKQSDEFEKIENGMTDRIKKSIVLEMSNRL